MLSKIGIGTANFTQKYGILSGADTMSVGDVDSILKLAIDNEVDTFDTAFAYGDFLSFIRVPSALKITTKFSVLDEYDEIFQKMKYAKEQNNLYIV